jgi:alcohol dehydrogenase
MTGFDIQPRTRLVFGVGTLARLGELVRDLPAQRVLIVTDKGIVQAGIVAKALAVLESAGIESILFDRVHENPTTDDVAECLQVAKACQIDAFVGLGGGSSLDTAKGCNFLLTNGGAMQDYWGVNKATKPMLPLIAIPTTAGTGSECQSFALISDAKTHHKMACGDVKAAARTALLDPELTLSQPRWVTTCTGIDAITHAVETAVTLKRTPHSLLYSREAFRLLIHNFQAVLEKPSDLPARANMQLGAAYAGIAIEASMLGAAHSMANPITAHFGTVHGQAVGMMLPGIIRFNAQMPEISELYRQLALSAGLISPEADANTALEILVKAVEATLKVAGFPQTLGEMGVPAEIVSTLAEEASKQWTATFNPRPITKSDFEALYRTLL